MTVSYFEYFGSDIKERCGEVLGQIKHLHSPGILSKDLEKIRRGSQQIFL